MKIALTLLLLLLSNLSYASLPFTNKTYYTVDRDDPYNYSIVNFSADGSYNLYSEWGDGSRSFDGSYVSTQSIIENSPVNHKYGEITLDYTETISDHFGNNHDKDYNERFYFVYSNGIIVLYTDDQIVQILYEYNENLIQKSYEIDASSQLTETLNGTEYNYPISNINNFALGFNRYHRSEQKVKESLKLFWAEGNTGNGIGESIDVTFNNFKESNLSGFIIFFNGVFKSDTLFNANIRAKEITLNNSMSITLEDIRQPQIIQIDSMPKEIKLTIEEIYENYKYEDLCLTSLIFLFNE